MEKIDSSTLPLEALNERRRRAVKMRMDGYGVDETARQCELARGTVISAHKAYLASGWSGVLPLSVPVKSELTGQSGELALAVVVVLLGAGHRADQIAGLHDLVLLQLADDVDRIVRPVAERVVGDGGVGVALPGGAAAFALDSATRPVA